MIDPVLSFNMKRKYSENNKNIVLFCYMNDGEQFRNVIKLKGLFRLSLI